MLSISAEEKKDLLEYCTINTAAFGVELKCYEPYPKSWSALQKMFRNRGGSWKGNTSSFIFLSNAQQHQNAVIKELQPVDKTNAPSVVQNLKTHADASLQMVPTGLIMPDPNQPRKYFDETAQAELIESVKANGILQPILLRPCTGDLAGTYLLVCGERRYRAALASDVMEVPAVIRTLSDAEALELQIVENLQRKEVHPMEEAVAFKSLLDSNQMTDEEIAARVGKKVHYVRQRVKLNSLVLKWQNLFFKNAFPLVDALQLCQFPEKEQNDLYDDLVEKSQQESAHPKVSISTWILSKYKGELSKASFDWNDPTLNKKMGPCTTCQFNTAVALLFPDMGTAKCLFVSCFKTKTDTNFQRELEKVKEDPSIVFVQTSYGSSTNKTYKALKAGGAKILKEYSDFNVVHKPDLPDWEEFKEDHVDEDTSEEEARDRFAGELKEYEEELSNYNEKISSAKAVKAFVVSDDQPGAYIYIEKKKGAGSASTKGGADDDTTKPAKQEIAEIKEREKRNKELDREKIYKRTLEELKDNAFLTNSASQSWHNQECIALCILLIDSSYKARDFAHKLLKVSSDDYSRIKIYSKLSELGADIYPVFYQLNRVAIYDRLYNQSELDFIKYGKAAAMMEVAKVWIPEHVKLYETEQKEKAEKRQTNIDKRIATLQKEKPSKNTSSK